MQRGADGTEPIRVGAAVSSRCGLVVDGSATIAEDITHGLAVVPVRIAFDDAVVLDTGSTNDYAAFYQRLRDGATPTTSTPAPGEYLEAFRRNPAESLVCLTMPARWSGMFDAATLAAQMLADEEGQRRVTVVETEAAAAALSLVARVAAELVAGGADTAAVTDTVGRACAEVRMFGSLATLTYVARSGRVPALLAGISNTLHVRPVFRMQQGDTGRVALARTTSGVIDALGKAAAEQLPAAPQRVLVFHADAGEEAEALAQRLQATLELSRCEISALSPIAGAYTGPGAFGFAALPGASAAAA